MKTINEEVNRISQLMGVDNTKNVVISEQLTLLRKLGLDDYVDDLVRVLDSHIDDLKRLNKLTDDEASRLRDFINDTNVRNAAKSAKTFDDLAEKFLKSRAGGSSRTKITGEKIKEISDLIKKLESDVVSAGEKYAKDVLENPQNPIHRNMNNIYDRTLREIEEMLANRSFKDIDEVYTEYNKLLSNLTDSAGNPIFKNLPEMESYLLKRMKEDPIFKNAVKKYKNNITTPPKWINDPDIGKNIGADNPMKKIGLGQEWVKPFLNSVERWFYGFINDARSLRIVQENQDKAVRDFNKLINGAFDEVLKSSSKDADKLALFTHKFRESFLQLGRTFKEGVDYDSLWKTLVENIKDPSNGYSAAELSAINEYLERVLKHNDNNRYLSLEEVILDAKKIGSADFAGKVADKVDEFVTTNAIKTSQNVAKENIPKWWERALSLIGTGRWQTPKELMTFYAKKGYRSKKALRGVIGRYFVINALIPFLGALGEWLMDNLLILLSGEDPNKYVRWVVGPEVQGDRSFSNYLSQWMVGGVSQGLGGDGFWSYFTRIFPGFVDDITVAMITGAQKGSEIDVVDNETEEEETKEDKAIKKLVSYTPIATGTRSHYLSSGLKRIYGDKINVDNYNKYFTYIKKGSNDKVMTGYFFLKGTDGRKYLSLTRDDSSGEETKYFAKTEDGKKEDNIEAFISRLKTLIDEGKIVEPKAFTNIPGISFGDSTTVRINNSITPIVDKILKEMKEGKKFGEDNFKHWKDTFKFKKYDEKTNQLKDVKISSKMDEIMDRIDHFRKKYDEDDAFVRAVVDVYGTQIDIIQHTKGLAHLTENIVVSGLMSVLATLRESKELVTWTVKHYKDGNWELVKGNFNKKELLNVGKTKREREERQKDSENPAEGLKKKEQESIMILNRDEKEGLNGLPTKVKQKVKEKLRQGWTTEKPFDFLSDFYTESEINSVFNDKIKIFKLKPSAEFFRSLTKNSAKITIKKGFCKSIKKCKKEDDLNEKERSTLNHFISKCESKFGI